MHISVTYVQCGILFCFFCVSFIVYVLFIKPTQNKLINQLSKDMVSIYFENQYMRELCRRYLTVIYKEIIKLQVPLNYQSKYNMSNLNIIYAD